MVENNRLLKNRINKKNIRTRNNKILNYFILNEYQFINAIVSEYVHCHLKNICLIFQPILLLSHRQHVGSMIFAKKKIIKNKIYLILR